MFKINRKRKPNPLEDVEYKILAPKNKFKPFNEKAQAEEEHLSSILFGGNSNFLKSLEEAEKEESVADQSPSTSPSTSTDSGVGEDFDDFTETERKPAWVDEDDDGIVVGRALKSQGRKLPQGGINERSNKYSKLLKHKFTSIVGTPKWASLKRKEENNSESDDEIMQTCGFLKQTSLQTLPPTTLEFKKLKDLNCETYSEGIVNSIEFHPTSSVALVAGNSGVATLYAVDAKHSSKLHNVAFDQYPILCAKFINGGNEAILGSRHTYIYSYDLMSAKVLRIPLSQNLTQFKLFVTSPDSKYLAAAGKWGEVHLLASRSKEKLFTLKQNSEVTALSFNSRGNLLFGHSVTGEVTVWDMNMRRVKHKWIDEGCIQGSALVISSDDNYVATGSFQGVVNMYETSHVLNEVIPRPRKSVFNLTTGITNLIFNSSSEMLVLASESIENSVRILHTESTSVFNNFPMFGTKLGHISAVNISPGGGYLALGNKKSVVSLYRLKHFKSY